MKVLLYLLGLHIYQHIVVDHRKIVRWKRLFDASYWLMDKFAGPSGCSSMYFKLGFGVGIKVTTYPDPYRPIAEGKKTRHESAAAEFKVMKRARKALGSWAPRVYFFLRVPLPLGWHTITFVEHIDGVELGKVVNNGERYMKFQVELGNALRRHGFDHSDLHPGNIMAARNGRWVIVDWGNSYVRSVEVVKRRQAT